jgi:hypothetical protein
MSRTAAIPAALVIAGAVSFGGAGEAWAQPQGPAPAPQVVPTTPAPSVGTTPTAPTMRPAPVPLPVVIEAGSGRVLQLGPRSSPPPRTARRSRSMT